MKKFEYKIESPSIENGKFISGYYHEVSNNFWGNQKSTIKHKFISEREWLNKKGEEGWELVGVLRNDMSYDIREYYFKREIPV